MIQKCTYLQGQLEKERETLRVWTESSKKTQEILGRGNWKTGLGYDIKKENSKTVKVEEHKVYTKPVKFKRATEVKTTSVERSCSTSGNNVNPDAPANPDADATNDNKEHTKSRLKQLLS